VPSASSCSERDGHGQLMIVSEMMIRENLLAVGEVSSRMGRGAGDDGDRLSDGLV
jgi:hypothetical protein